VLTATRREWVGKTPVTGGSEEGVEDAPTQIRREAYKKSPQKDAAKPRGVRNKLEPNRTRHFPGVRLGVGKSWETRVRGARKRGQKITIKKGKDALNRERPMKQT